MTCPLNHSPSVILLDGAQGEAGEGLDVGLSMFSLFSFNTFLFIYVFRMTIMACTWRIT
jgi:hypothetical protein